MNVFIDIETIPQQPEAETKALIAETIQCPATMSKQETIDEWHAGARKYAGVKDALIEETYRKTSFDGAKGQIVSVAFAVEDNEIFQADVGSDKNDFELLRLSFSELAAQLGGKSPWFIGHNIGGFDLKFLFQRAVINKVNPKIDLKQYGKHGSQFYDTMLAWAGYGNRISQDNLCAALGLDGKPSDITGANVWDHFKAGNIKRIGEYNKSDIQTIRKIYSRLTFAD